MAEESISASRDLQRADRIRRLTALGRALTHVSRVEEIPSLIVNEAARLLETDRVILLADDGHGTWQVQAVRGLPDRVFLWRFPAEKASESELRRELGGIFERPFLFAPLVRRNQDFGLLAVSTRRNRAGRDFDEWLLSSIADQAAVAMENVQLELEARRAPHRSRSPMPEHGESSKLVLDGIRHDLRAPLSAIGLVCELLEGELLGPVNERQKEAIQDIRVSAKHAESMALDLLDVGRLNAGVYELDMEPIPLADVVGEAVAVTRPRASSRGQTLEVERMGSAEREVEVEVEVDADAFRKVLVNVLTNAVTYSSPESTIRVAYGPDPGLGGTAAVRVRDEGPGILEEHLERIFQPYFRIESESESRGMGLGLAISREILHEMGGSIEVHSRPGEGATFDIRVRTAPSRTATPISRVPRDGA